MRTLYSRLLRMHPSAFRDRFQAEMLFIFDDAGTRRRQVWLLADAVLSLVRQWALRPYKRPEAAQTAVVSDGIPIFALIENVQPRPAALLFGGLLSAALFSSVLAGFYFGGNSAALPTAVVDIHWSWGWDLTDSRPLETPAGLRLKEWLDTYNTGNVFALRRFTSQSIVNFQRYPETNEPNVEFWTKLFNRAGPFQLHSVRESSGEEIVGVARTKSGDWWWIRLRVSADERHLIRGVTVQNLAEARTPPKE